MPSANMVVPYRFSGFCMFRTSTSKQKHAIYIVGWFVLVHDRHLQESEPRCASSLFLLTVKADDINDCKVRCPPKPPRAPHIQKVSGSIPPGSSPVLLCLWAAGCWLLACCCCCGCCCCWCYSCCCCCCCCFRWCFWPCRWQWRFFFWRWGYKMVLLSVHICYWCWWRCWC